MEQNLEILIRECTHDDVSSLQHLQPEGWDDIVRYFRFYCETPFCYPVAAVAGGGIIGVGCGIFNNGSGWVAHIIVSPEHRGKGIGAALTRFVMGRLTVKGCRTLLLIATESGEPLYWKLGFRAVGRYRFFRGPRLEPGPDSGRIDPLEAAEGSRIGPLEGPDAASVLELDSSMTGEDRRRMLDGHLHGGFVYRDGSSGGVRGFFLPSLGEGVIVARDGEAGIGLLRLKHGFGPARTVLPEENEVGAAYLIGHDFEQYNVASRMEIGDAIRWRPDMIFSRVGGHYG